MAHRILGIDIGATEIKAVLADVSWREMKVLGMYVEAVPSAAEVAHRPAPAAPEFPPRDDQEPAEGEEGEQATPPTPAEPPPPWAFAVADLIKKHNIAYHEIHVTLPGTEATTHIMTLPFENRRRIEQVLPFELENQVPFELEDMHITFDVLGKASGGGARVLACLTPKDKIRRFLAQLAQAGLDPRIVSFSPYTLFAAARLALPDEEGAYAVVDFGHTHTNVAVLDGGGLVNVRSLSIGSTAVDEALASLLRIDAAKAAEIKIGRASLMENDAVAKAMQRCLQPWLARLRQTLQAVRAADGLEVTRLYLTGRAGQLRGLVEYLSDELGLKVMWLNTVPANLPISTDADNPEQQARFAYAFALAQHGIAPLQAIRLNLRHSEFFYRQQQKAVKASLRTVAVAGIIILLLLIYNLTASYFQKKHYLAAITDQVVQIYLKAFPGSQPSQPLEQFQAQVAKTMAKYKTVAFFGDGELRAVDILKVLSEAIPPDITVDFKKMDITPESIKIEGECASFPDVDRIEEALKKFPSFTSVKKESSAAVSEKVKFKFVIHFTAEKPNRAAPSLARTPATPREAP